MTFYCFRPNPNKTTRFNLLKAVGLLVVLFMLLLILVNVLVVVIGGAYIESQSEDALIMQTGRLGLDAAADSAGLFDREFDRNAQSVVGRSVALLAMAFSGDYAFAPIASFLDFDYTTLKLPTYFDPRQERLASNASVYQFPDQRPTTILSGAQTAIRDDSSTGDRMFDPAYQSNDGTFAVYYGHNAPAPYTNCIWRRFPGVPTCDLITDPSCSFTACIRPWYTSATDALTTSEVYRDFTTDKPMVTQTKRVRRSDTNAFIGVIGADLEVGALNEILRRTSLLDPRGKVSRFESDGSVVGDREWPYENPTVPLYSYRDLREPRISTTDWNRFSGLAPDTTGEFLIDSDGEEWRVYVVRGERYITIGFVPESVIGEPIDEVTSQISSTKSELLGVIFGTSIPVTAVILLFVLILVWLITRTVMLLLDDCDLMFQNVGTTRDLTYGWKSLRGLPLDETAALQANTHSMIATLDRERIAAAQPTILSSTDLPMYGAGEVSVPDMQTGSTGWVALPTAPPAMSGGPPMPAPGGYGPPPPPGPGVEMKPYPPTGEAGRTDPYHV